MRDITSLPKSNITSGNLEDDYIVLDENFKPPIERSLTIGKDTIEEVSILSADKEWIYAYSSDRLTNVFSKIFSLDFLDFVPKPNENIRADIKKIKNGRDFLIKIVFGNERSLTYIEQGVLPEFMDTRTENGVVTISAWPIKRKTYSVFGGREAEIDLLKVFSEYPGLVNSTETLKRINEHYTVEWNKIHGKKKADYVR